MHDAVHALDVEATRCHIRSHESHAFSVDKRLHGSVPLALSHASMESLNRYTVFFHLFCDPVHAGTGSAKHDATAAFADEFG